MKIIYLLSGPGKEEGFSKNIKEYLKKDLKCSNKITFIASSPDRYEKNDLYAQGLKNHMVEVMEIGEVNILDERTKVEDGKRIINESDVVYLMGGNPFTQLEFIKNNKYDDDLKNFQGVILGTSCGAMNLAKKAYYSKDEDFDKSLFYEGIAIVDVTIDPHFDINKEEEVNEAKKYSEQHKIIGLPNESAIRIQENDIKYINKCFLFELGNMREID